MGNKTTNAKARTGQAGGAKGKEVEKAQAKPTTNQKSRQRAAEVAPIKFEVKVESQGTQEEEEPEFAPPRPKDIPYESDVLPQGFLTFEGLKHENLFKGYYQHFHNPIDENGVSRQDKQFQQAMNKVMAEAEAQNQRVTDELDWNSADLTDTTKPTAKETALREASVQTGHDQAKKSHPRYPSTSMSKRAASTLSIPANTIRRPLSKPVVLAMRPRKPLGSILMGKRAVPEAVARKESSAESAVGEAASRTTLGYNKGRSASSLIRTAKRSVDESARTGRLGQDKGSSSINSQSDLTITPARLRQAALKKLDCDPRPEFASVFDATEDDEDLPPMSGPLESSDDEEEFELKFEI